VQNTNLANRSYASGNVGLRLADLDVLPDDFTVTVLVNGSDPDFVEGDVFVGFDNMDTDERLGSLEVVSSGSNNNDFGGPIAIGVPTTSPIDLTGVTNLAIGVEAFAQGFFQTGSTATADVTFEFGVGACD
jgi:hypothetical protein